MDFENLLVELEGNLAWITINRPKKLNALNKATIAELGQAFKALEANQDVRVIMLRGSGEKAFVAGADISEFSTFSVAQGKELAAKGHAELFDLVQNLSTPVIAAVNGYALGGGLELAMSCHIRIASDNAKLGLPEVTLGLIPGYGGTQRLAQLVGKGRALEMILSAQMIGADKALDMGLVNHVVALDELKSTCEGLAKSIAKNSPQGIAAAIASVNAGFEEGVNGYEAEIDAFGTCFGTEDFKEGTTAFLEKRKPNF
ncbi:MAG: enoyl-CoA hydratase/isomerase family protein [Flavobacteriaceae bacterium]